MRHPAYRRLARSTGDGVRPPVAPPAGEPVCSRCRAFASCCFCDAAADAMRLALRRIAEIHSACRPDCPERQRLAAVHTGPAVRGAGWHGDRS